MTTFIEVHPASKYSAEEIERGLVILALESGNVSRCRKILKEEWGKAPDANTIGRWLERYRDRYAEIREKVAPDIKARMADVHTDLANRIAMLESKTVDALDAELADLNPKDKANLLRNAAVAGAVHVDKAQLLRGEATHIVRRELPEIFRALAAKGVVIEGVAEEIPQDQRELEAGKPNPGPRRSRRQSGSSTSRQP
jgi:hypothetical protein